MNSTIETITSSKHLAVVGVSDKSFGGIIYKTLKKNGYAVYPVHPTRESFDGDRCLASLRDLPPNVKSAVLAVSPTAAEQVIDDAVSAGITHLWFQQGKDFSAAVARAQAKGIQTVSRKCILMYAQPVTGIHSVHRFLARAFGRL
jgi:predicted CoA-binding protein